MKFPEFVSKYIKSLVALVVALAVIFLTLGFLHKQFSGNLVGQWAGKLGDVVSGSSSGF